jgi:hypothetical protein
MLGSLPLLLRVGVWGQELPVRVWQQELGLPVRPSVVWLESIRSDPFSFSG